MKKTNMKMHKTAQKTIIKFVWAIIFFMGCFFSNAFPADSDLTVSADGRYLIKKSTGSQFFYMGDTAWWLWASLRANEIVEYLDDAKNQGFNVIQLHMTPHRPNAYANAYGDKPYGINNTDALNFVTAYWDYAEWAISQAHNRGLYCAIIVGHPLRKGDSREPPFAFAKSDLTSAYNSGWQIANRLKAYNDKIIWLGGWDLDPVSMGIVNNIRAQMEGIADAINGVNNNNGSADWSTTMMTLHTSPNGKNNSSSDYFHTDAWLDFNLIQTYGNLHKAIENITADLNLRPAKPTILVEGAYEGTGAGNYGQGAKVKRYKHYPDSSWTWYSDEYGEILPWHARYQAYQTIFSGAAGTGYGHRALVTHSWVLASRTAGYNAEGRDDQKHIKNLISSRNFLNLQPDQSIIASGDGGKELTHVRAIIASDKSYAYVYTTDGRSFSVNLAEITVGERVRAQWYDPGNGSYSFIADFAKITQSFNPGASGVDNDMVLVLEGIDNGEPPPPGP